MGAVSTGDVYGLTLSTTVDVDEVGKFPRIAPWPKSDCKSSEHYWSTASFRSPSMEKRVLVVVDNHNILEIVVLDDFDHLELLRNHFIPDHLTSIIFYWLQFLVVRWTIVCHCGLNATKSRVMIQLCLTCYMVLVHHGKQPIFAC
jgi:hypothetical protein